MKQHTLLRHLEIILENVLYMSLFFVMIHGNMYMFSFESLSQKIWIYHPLLKHFPIQPNLRFHPLFLYINVCGLIISMTIFARHEGPTTIFKKNVPIPLTRPLPFTSWESAVVVTFVGLLKLFVLILLGARQNHRASSLKL